MKLKNLRLLNFKNHEDSRWDFNERVNCFIGDNGCGKTNVLDAIHYLSLTKSYFNSQDSVSVNFDSDFFTIKGSFEKDEINSDIICNVSEKTSKSLKINDKRYKRFSDHIGSFPVVFISPTDTNLITENSDTRRRYIDSGISQFDSGYLKNLISYNKTLKQRNKLLKHFAETNTFDEITLS
ncbi:MAG: DNA replication/repair protein RecF, partial [Flavobacteriales bacterium]|nr:DNA replication/repair protein RecF [Flavobacteriales bacterium]